VAVHSGVTRKTPVARAAVQPYRLALAVQYASEVAGLPPRAQIRRWVAAALAGDAVVTVRVVDAEEGRALNRDFRGKDYATNVLTFVYSEPAAPIAEGDIVLCAPVVQAEAQAQGKALRDHYAHLLVHGVLHLQGHDHQDDASAAMMESLERAILGRMRIPDPYADRDTVGVALKAD
jgi:probable rRNA maturation factor